LLRTFRNWNVVPVIVAAFIASLNTAETVVPALMLIDQLPGVVDTTVGGITSAFAEKPIETNTATSKMNFLLLKHVEF
jgi:hypothetical protein